MFNSYLYLVAALFRLILVKTFKKGSHKRKKQRQREVSKLKKNKEN